MVLKKLDVVQSEKELSLHQYSFKPGNAIALVQAVYLDH